jgi:16S rRNA (uracil1498-N3)-methyltransferase
MRITRIYHPEALTIDTLVCLSETASHHLQNVLRIKPNQSLELFNGDGYQYTAVVEQLSRKQVHVRIESRSEHPLLPHLSVHLAQGICRGEKMDLVIQKATELGATEITPIITDYSNVKLNKERLQKKRLHWQSVANSACEQSGRCDIVTVRALQTFSEFIKVQHGENCFLLEPTATEKIPQRESVESLTVVVGPEGGFSDTELALAKDSRCQLISLGQRVLRTETAGLAALSIIQYLWG